jgi:hypothetical protein
VEIGSNTTKNCSKTDPLLVSGGASWSVSFAKCWTFHTAVLTACAPWELNIG